MTDRQACVLAVLSAGGEQARFSPVQVKELFFLLDGEVSGLIDALHFDFQAYDYGPFDQTPYRELDALELQGSLNQIGGGWYEDTCSRRKAFAVGRQI